MQDAGCNANKDKYGINSCQNSQSCEDCQKKDAGRVKFVCPTHLYILKNTERDEEGGNTHLNSTQRDHYYIGVEEPDEGCKQASKPSCNLADNEKNHNAGKDVENRYNR